MKPACYSNTNTYKNTFICGFYYAFKIKNIL